VSAPTAVAMTARAAAASNREMKNWRMGGSSNQATREKGEMAPVNAETDHLSSVT
jgi:hypothetical protein